MRLLPSLRRFSRGPGSELELRRDSLDTWQYRSKALARTLSVIQILSIGARRCLAARQQRAVGREDIGVTEGEEDPFCVYVTVPSSIDLSRKL